MLPGCMPLHDQDSLSPPDADLRFELIIRKPAAAIALITAVVLTAITWITTFLLTVTSVAAYVTQNVALASAQEPPWNLASLVSVGGNRPSADSAPVEKDSRADAAPLSSDPLSPLMTPIPALAAPVLRELPMEEPLSTIALNAQSVEPRPEGVTMHAPRVAQEPNVAPIAQSAIPQNVAAAQGQSEPQCGDGFWSGICKERLRWSQCHPDKWDTVPECTVQKFEVAS
jgi:hypothetical protein